MIISTKTILIISICAIVIFAFMAGIVYLLLWSLSKKLSFSSDTIEGLKAAAKMLDSFAKIITAAIKLGEFILKVIKFFNQDEEDKD